MGAVRRGGVRAGYRTFGWGLKEELKSPHLHMFTGFMKI